MSRDIPRASSLRRRALSHGEPAGVVPEAFVAAISSDVVVRRDQVIRDIVLVGPGGRLPPACLLQAALPVRVVSKGDNLSRSLIDIAGRAQQSRLIDQFLDPSHSRADQRYAGQQGLLSYQRAGFPGRGQQREVSRTQQRTDVTAASHPSLF